MVRRQKFDLSSREQYVDTTVPAIRFTTQSAYMKSHSIDVFTPCYQAILTSEIVYASISIVHFNFLIIYPLFSKAPIIPMQRRALT